MTPAAQNAIEASASILGAMALLRADALAAPVSSSSVRRPTYPPSPPAPSMHGSTVAALLTVDPVT
jgi:hypothetical protein